MPSTPSTTGCSFLAGGAALAAVPAIATPVGGVFAEPASPENTLLDHTPMTPSAFGRDLTALGYRAPARTPARPRTDQQEAT
jgi:hypothetical protein